MAIQSPPYGARAISASSSADSVLNRIPASTIGSVTISCASSPESWTMPARPDVAPARWRLPALMEMACWRLITSAANCCFESK